QSRVQMLKKYSGMNTMYFRLNDQRSTILMGSAAMNWISVISIMKRTKPMRMKKPRKIVFASTGGKTNRYTNTKNSPGSSRTNQCRSMDMPKEPQMKSDSMMLFSGTFLCGSHGSKGPKKFQFGPRRNVPSTISTHQRTTKPKRNVVTANLRCANVK